MAKKKTKSKSAVPSYPVLQRINASITKAKNGYVVESYGPNGESTYIAKTKKEAKERAAKLLG